MSNKILLKFIFQTSLAVLFCTVKFSYGGQSYDSLIPVGMAISTVPLGSFQQGTPVPKKSEGQFEESKQKLVFEEDMRGIGSKDIIIFYEDSNRISYLGVFDGQTHKNLFTAK